jgi:GNAT superfamily N-acetyltransferase
MVEIRKATAANRDAIWDIFREVVAARDTYAFDPGMSRQDALGYWFQTNTRTYVAESSGRIVGTYILRPNQSGGGSHVANAAFMVAPVARGRGIGRAMAEHCLTEGRRLGFALCSLISLFQPTTPHCAFGKRSVSKSLALCRVHFVIPKKDMSMFTLCFARFCSRNIDSCERRMDFVFGLRFAFVRPNWLIDSS